MYESGGEVVMKVEICEPMGSVWQQPNTSSLVTEHMSISNFREIFGDNLPEKDGASNPSNRHVTDSSG